MFTSPYAHTHYPSFSSFVLSLTHTSFPLKIILLRLRFSRCMRRKNFNKRERFHANVFTKCVFMQRYIRSEGEIWQFTILLSVPGANVNAHYIGMRLLPITSDTLSLWLIHIMLKLRDWRTHPIRINCGWVHGETHATFRTGGHSTRVVNRRLPRHNYPRTVYLRPLFNLQLMFQIAINPCQYGCHLSTMITECIISVIQCGLSS